MLLFATYLNMVLIMLVVVIITPAVMVVGIMYKTKELHTKYRFFAVNLLAANIIHILNESDTLKKIILPLHIILQFTSILLLMTLAVKRTTVIALPFRHKYYINNKRIGTIAAVWGLPAGDKSQLLYRLI